MTMRGASSEALAALVDQLEQGIASADAAKVGDDLFGVAGRSMVGEGDHRGVALLSDAFDGRFQVGEEWHGATRLRFPAEVTEGARQSRHEEPPI